MDVLNWLVQTPAQSNVYPDGDGHVDLITFSGLSTCGNLSNTYRHTDLWGLYSQQSYQRQQSIAFGLEVQWNPLSALPGVI